MDSPTERSETDVCHLFVDEAGVPDIFDGKGRSKIGSSGVSYYFALGMLEVDEPEKLATALLDLRDAMKRDPYFATAESFKPERKKTAVLLHAKDDLPDVRVKVFDLLRSFGPAIRFRAVICDKEAIRTREEAKRRALPSYRYNPDYLYDELARGLFARFSRMADRFKLHVAKRGAKDRNAALLAALEQAEQHFEASFGFSRGGTEAWDAIVTDPRSTVCLQAADYFLWALQRFYEPRVHPETGQVTHEDRYLSAMWPQISQIHDLNFGPAQGTFFTRDNPLTLEKRFGPKLSRKKKKP